MHYFQGKAFLCGVDRNRAIQAFESVSECDSIIYGKVCYELGSYYATVYSEVNDDDPQKTMIGEKAEAYLLKAQQYEPKDSKSIEQLLKNLKESSTMTARYSR